MSRSDYGNEMDQQFTTSGSVKRARERAQAGLPRMPPPPVYTPDNMEDSPPGDLRAPPRRPMAALPPNQRVQKTRASPNDGRNAISRPTQVPQWPLPGPPLVPGNKTESEPYRPPPGRPQQAPQRPPRPSQVPSLLDQSRLQDPTPIFLNPDADYYSESPTSPSSQTSSNAGDPNDFPVPPQSHLSASRRSANLGPPPSARRGASSFYSNPSYVSPIPEESLASRSHGSYASSAAMPDSWPAGSREASPTFYDEGISEKSRGSVYDDFGDESKLVRSASIGKRGKPSLITTKSSGSTTEKQLQSPDQPSKSPYEHNPQNSWAAMTAPNAQTEDLKSVLTPDAILGAYAAASATDLTENRMKSPEPQMQSQSHPQFPQPQYNRLSAIRRPPRLDIDAVRSMEERGSMTSLPDLIRRATRLANMMDRGRRPASRFEDLNDYLDEKGQIRDEKDISGLSDMLAAFPPPAHAQNDSQSRGSWFRTTSWPLAPSRDGLPSRSGLRNITPQPERRERRKRCCGLPIWGVVLLIILLLGVIAAAVFVPLEFFVWKNLGQKDDSTSALSQCQASLDCKNGGTNVISDGTCSCICTNGYTGSDCSKSGSDGCTTTDLVSSVDDETISNVTLGKAIPRLISGSYANFSIPLSGTTVLAKLNNSDLSCIAQNSLVTFDGSYTRKGDGSDEVTSTKRRRVVKREMSSSSAAATTAISVSPDDAATTLVLDQGSPTTSTSGAATKTATASKSATTDADAEATGTFTVTQEVLDFARVAVLYVLQEESEDDAGSAQTSLQDFFTEAASDGVTQSDASSLKIGGENTIDLVNYEINVGNGTVGGNSKREVRDNLSAQFNQGRSKLLSRRGGSVLPSR